MKVYIVTDGEYSDYMIQEVFSSRATPKPLTMWITTNSGKF